MTHYTPDCKQARELLGTLQKGLVPIYCTSFLAVEENKQLKMAQLLQLWNIDGSIIQQLQSPALGLGQHQGTLISESSSVVQPVPLAFQQQIQTLKTQHKESVDSRAQQQQQLAGSGGANPHAANGSQSQGHPTSSPASNPHTHASSHQPPIQMPGSSEYGISGPGQDPTTAGHPGPRPPQSDAT
ncbi:hypothetical protein GH733_000902 [Mirounga leonina]|nr:hypothetical protein GH733_000902 [Mirounga leonina]